MQFKLYDTYTRSHLVLNKKETPISFYSCGPTVYDYPHIGNWYAFVRWDILNRALLAHGYTTKWVMNITDVGHLVSDEDDGEDKLEKGAKREGKTAWDVAKFYGEYFKNKLTELNFSEISVLPKATEHIPEQIELVKKLEAGGHTYNIDDGVYFDTSTFNDYGKLAHLDLENLKAGARVELNPQKRNVTDFALWKFSPKDETRDMEWDSPWGKGFPGWHIECSAMSMKYLGETLDIHAGGIDHIPVHHTNEIAQSEAATGKPFANIWVHSNFILVDGKKMSKSLGNFYVLEDLKDASGMPYDADVIRLAIMESHYQTEANFSLEVLAAAEARMRGLSVIATALYQPHTQSAQPIDIGVVASFFDNILEALSNNLNTPLVLKALNEWATYVSNKTLLSSDEATYAELFNKTTQATGLSWNSFTQLSSEEQMLFTQYTTAKQAKNYDEVDTLRSALAEHGIVVKDLSGQEYIWSRTVVASR